MDLAAVVSAARAETFAAGSARLAYDACPHLHNQRGARFATKLVRTLTGQHGSGYIDLVNRRHLTWVGGSAGQAAASGRPKPETAPEERAARVGSTWWLLDALACVVEAVEAEPDAVRGVACRRLVARVDLPAASALSPYGLAAPAVDRVDMLRALPVDVWVAEQRLARVLVTSVSTYAIDLWDYGVDVSAVDWSAGLAL